MSKKVLVIDDEADVRTFLTTMLRRNGFDTCTAPNGFEGLEVLKRERPDLVTLDVMMPMRSGIDFYRNLRKDKELSKTPIIVVSGLSGRDFSLVKPVAIFYKPIEPEAFMAKVHEVLG